MNIPRRLGPKRASKIRKLFNLSKEDDVRQYVIKRPLPVKEGKKPRFKAPKIQRLVTPRMLQVRHRSSPIFLFFSVAEQLMIDSSSLKSLTFATSFHSISARCSPRRRSAWNAARRRLPSTPRSSLPVTRKPPRRRRRGSASVLLRPGNPRLPSARRRPRPSSSHFSEKSVVLVNVRVNSGMFRKCE